MTLTVVVSVAIIAEAVVVVALALYSLVILMHDRMMWNKERERLRRDAREPKRRTDFVDVFTRANELYEREPRSEDYPSKN